MTYGLYVLYANIQDTKTSTLPNGVPSGDSTASGVNEDLPTVSGYSGISIH